jgi:hypothetical protein
MSISSVSKSIPESDLITSGVLLMSSVSLSCSNPKDSVSENSRGMETPSESPSSSK